MGLTVGSPQRQSGWRNNSSKRNIETVDDNEHPKLEKMLNDIYKFGISINVTDLTIYNDNKAQTKQKLDILLPRLIKHNSLYFPNLKKLIFTNHCGYIFNYIKNNVNDLLSNTNIDTIEFENGIKNGYKVPLYTELSQFEINVNQWYYSIKHPNGKHGVPAKMVRN